MLPSVDFRFLRGTFEKANRYQVLAYHLSVVRGHMWRLVKRGRQACWATIDRNRIIDPAPRIIDSPTFGSTIKLQRYRLIEAKVGSHSV
jgi:hypothetical protein